MVDSIKNYRSLFEQKKGQLLQINKEIKHYSNSITVLKEHKENLESAQAIIQMIAQATQEELQFHINELVSLSLAAVFDDSYEFEVDFVQRRNQTEADLWFVRDGERIHPLYATGGGPINVAAFALRVSLWSLHKNRSRAILVLDEPFANLSIEHHTRASAMLKEISHKLNMQILVVTHSEEMANSADLKFKVTQKKGQSYVRQI